MYTRLQQAQQDNTDNFQKEQQKKMQPIMQKVMNVLFYRYLFSIREHSD